MNIIKGTNKDYKVIDGGVSVSDTEAKFTVEMEEGETLETIEENFTELPAAFKVLDVDGETAVAVYNGFNRLKAVTKNIDDNTAEIVLAKQPLEDRVAELESTIDTLTENMLME